MATEVEIDEDAADAVHLALGLGKAYARLTPGEVRQLFPNSRLMSYVKDDYIVTQEEESQDLYVIVTGTVAITQTLGTAAGQVNTMKDGDIFGEIALVGDGVRTASAVASVESRVFRIHQGDIRKLMEQNPDLADNLKALADKRLKD